MRHCTALHCKQTEVASDIIWDHIFNMNRQNCQHSATAIKKTSRSWNQTKKQKTSEMRYLWSLCVKLRLRHWASEYWVPFFLLPRPAQGPKCQSEQQTTMDWLRLWLAIISCVGDIASRHCSIRNKYKLKQEEQVSSSNNSSSSCSGGSTSSFCLLQVAWYPR